MEQDSTITNGNAVPVNKVNSGKITNFIKIKANAFLHHMVRNIVGTLLKIGRGERESEWIISVLDSRDRKEAGPTAEPQGLYFIKAHYQTI